MLGRLRRAVIASWLALGMGLTATTAAAKSGESGNEDGLVAARSLFAEALKDEEAKRFAEALDKFQRVRAVRDTAQVEYRIGSCYEGLRQPVAAYLAYQKATVLAQDELRSADVVEAALDRLHALAKHLGWLSLTLPTGAPADVQVHVDESLVPVSALHEAIVLEPGPHVVTASATDATPFRSSIVLPEGAHVALTISLGPVPTAAQEAPKVEAPKVDASPAPAERPQPRRTTATAGWITLGGGAALLAGAGVVVIARSSDISTISNACPGGMCHVDMYSQPGKDLQSMRSRAVIEGPVAIGLGAGGLVAAGIGAYLVLSSSNDIRNSAAVPTIRIGPLMSSGSRGIALFGQFR